MTATTLTNTPPAGLIGNDTCPLTVSDGNDGLDSANLTITVTMHILDSGILNSLDDDPNVRSGGNVIPTGTVLLVGRSGTSPGIDRASVLVFRPPDPGPVENTFAGVTLHCHFQG